MANFLDYLDWRGDLSFEKSPFNPVDALLLAQLSYVPFNGVVSGLFDRAATIADAAANFDPKKADEKQISLCFEQDCDLLTKLAGSERFRHIPMCGYIARTDAEEETQFSALTYRLAPGRYYICFRGTDRSIAGWREDFSFSYLPETPGQRFAAEYVQQFARHNTGQFALGGHSKGGNFAVYGAYCADENTRARITEIFDFDGPGFRDEVAGTDSYRALIPKITSIIPRSSLVGQMLTSNTEHKIVNSRAVSIPQQHLTYSWEVMRDDFVYAQGLSKTGVFINKTVTGWLNETDDSTRQALTEAVFDLIQSSEADTFYEMNQHKIKSARAILRAMRRLTPEEQLVLKNAISMLAQQSRKALFPEKTDKKEDGSAQAAEPSA